MRLNKSQKKALTLNITSLIDVLFILLLFFVVTSTFKDPSASALDLELPKSSKTQSDETPDEEFPLILTSGRVVYHFLSGNQTRRIGFLSDQCPEPYVEIHPETAMKMKINDGERVKVVSRRGEGVFPTLVVKTIRPDTIFIPYHWGETLAVNQLTNPKLDPTSKIPEYKACSARIEKIATRELPIYGSQKKGMPQSEVRKGK